MYLQQATYWAPAGFGAEGEVFSAPATILCRWEDIAELFLNYQGEQVTSRSIVYTETRLTINGYLFLGISAAANPAVVTNAFKIRQSLAIPDLRNVRSEFRAIL